MQLPGREWWDRLDWATTLRASQTTYVQVPERLRGAFTAARGKALEVWADAVDRGAAGAEWKALLALDLLLLAHGRSAATCAEQLEERLALWWGGQWEALWTSVVKLAPPPPSPHQASGNRQRAARVQTLASAGEEGRALTAVSGAKLAPRTPQTFSKLEELFFDTELPRAAPVQRTPPTPELRQQVEEEVLRLLLKPPRLTSPGLLGTRLEHLAACSEDPDTLKLLSTVVAKMAFGEVPAEVLRALRTGEVTALKKGEEDVRPVVVGATLRRLGLRALVRVRKEELSNAVGEHQYGVGRKAGAQLLVQRLLVQKELRPEAAFLKVDMEAAFQKVERKPAAAAVAEALPHFAGALDAWYSGQTTHLWRDAAGKFKELNTTRGFDQGCPLAAAAFCVAQRTVLDPWLNQVLQVDPQAKVYSFLDDTYLVVDKRFASLALQWLGEAVVPLGLTLNNRKTVVWSPTGTEGLPLELLVNYQPSLPVLGKHLSSQGDTVEAPVNFGANAASSLSEATARLSTLWNKLAPLLQAGLSRQAAGALLRTYAGAASQYSLQLEAASEADADTYDAALVHCWEQLADRSLTEEAKTRLGLPARLGGCGVQFAATRKHAAQWATWSKLLGDVLADTALSSAADLLDALPQLTTVLNAARRGLARQGVHLSEGAALADALRQSNYTQSLLVRQVQKKTYANLLATLQPDLAAGTRGAGGPGAVGFLLYPSEASCSLEDPLWSTALRQRLRLPRAECSEAELPRAHRLCQCRKESGALCGAQLDDHGFHAVTEQSGGGTLQRHSNLEKAVGGLVSRWHNTQPLFEQRVPAWDRPSRRRDAPPGTIERAILDIEFVGPDGRRWIDVTVRHPAAGDTAAVRAAARRDGEATRRAERQKHQRYPGSQLTPFALETPGRLGAEARLWLLTQVRSCVPADQQTKELTRAYKVISCALQADVARQLRKAAGLR